VPEQGQCPSDPHEVRYVWNNYVSDQTLGTFSNMAGSDFVCMQCMVRHGLLTMINSTDDLSGYRFLLGGLTRTSEPNTGCAKVDWNLIECLQSTCGSIPVTPSNNHAFQACVGQVTKGINPATPAPCWQAYQAVEQGLQTLGLASYSMGYWTYIEAEEAWETAVAAACGAS
jgi:hypothetical protein